MRHSSSQGSEKIALWAASAAPKASLAEAKAAQQASPTILKNVTPVGLNGAFEDLVVAGKGALHSLGIPLPQPGGALYVGEQEGHSACWRAAHSFRILFSLWEDTTIAAL